MMAKHKKQLKKQAPAKRKPAKKKGKGSPPEPKKLTEKQRRFVEFYMGQAAGNATEAARLAGYSMKTAHRSGAQNMQKYAILEAINERVKADPAIATREDRQNFWTSTMDNTDVEMHNRLRASELLGKSQADFVERHDHNVSFSWVDVVKSAKAALAKRRTTAE